MPPRAWAQTGLYVALGAAALLGPLWWLIRALGVGESGLGPGLVLLLAGLLLLGLCWVFVPRVDLPGRSPHRGRRGARRVALTFDDGPGDDTAAVLEALRRHGARATFFCVGARAAARPELVRRLVESGHEIGNHTHEHCQLHRLGRAEIARQIDLAQEALIRAGAPPPRWFRAPHGFKSPLLPALLRRRGLRLCAWTRGVWDTDCPGADVIARRAAVHLRDGAILLLHDGGGDRRQTAAALDEILAECRRRGLAPVTLGQLLSE